MKVKVTNLRQPGQPIMFNFKGKQYEFEDREVVELPGEVVRHLANDCVIKTFRQKQGVDKEGMPTMVAYPVEVPRFSVSPVARQYVEKNIGTTEDKN